MTTDRTAQESVLRELRKLIITGQLEPGQQIVQETLSAQLGVSRVPLREALKVLEGEGHVIYHPHRGYFVADLSVEDLVEVYRIRAILEDEAIRVGVPNLTDEDIAYIEELMQEVEQAALAGDVAQISAANRRFHFAVYEASNLPRLVRMIRTLWDATDAYRAVYFGAPANLDQMQAEHRLLLTALANRDVTDAIKVQNDHREGSVTKVSSLLSH